MDGLNSRLDTAKNVPGETTQKAIDREKEMKIRQGVTKKMSDRSLTGVPEVEAMFEEIMAENFPKSTRDSNPHNSGSRNLKGKSIHYNKYAEHQREKILLKYMR